MDSFPEHLRVRGLDYTREIANYGDLSEERQAIVYERACMLRRLGVLFDQRSIVADDADELQEIRGKAYKRIEEIRGADGTLDEFRWLEFLCSVISELLD
jgi:hypothetical protein